MKFYSHWSTASPHPPSPPFFCDAAGLFNWYRCFYFQRLRELMSPICRILLLYANQKTKFVEVQNISKATKKEKMSLKNILRDLVEYLYFSIFSWRLFDYSAQTKVKKILPVNSISHQILRVWFKSLHMRQRSFFIKKKAL